MLIDHTYTFYNVPVPCNINVNTCERSLQIGALWDMCMHCRICETDLFGGDHFATRMYILHAGHLSQVGLSHH